MHGRTTIQLSARERDVLNWLALGKSGPEIAMILGISVCTVRIHIRGLVRKLEAANIAHAVHRGHEWGILGTGSPRHGGTYLPAASRDCRRIGELC